jgi:hypothetical protein
MLRENSASIRNLRLGEKGLRMIHEALDTLGVRSNMGKLSIGLTP